MIGDPHLTNILVSLEKLPVYYNQYMYQERGIMTMVSMLAKNEHKHKSHSGGEGRRERKVIRTHY